MPTGTGSRITTSARVDEQLFAADLSKAKRLGGKYPFVADGGLPTDAIRGGSPKLEMEGEPPAAQVKLRKGMMFPEKPGVMAAATAEDVVFTFNRLARAQRRSPPTSITSTRSKLSTSTRSCSPSRNSTRSGTTALAWGHYSGIMPKEVADAGAGNWKNVNGTGPFMLTDFVQGNSET